LAWIEYYKLYPFDDFTRYHKPASLIASGLGIETKVALDWLQPEVYDGDFTEADINTLKAFGMNPPVKG
jgi:hypothetical protein